jgi:3-phosphoshikimate 1-carboxyvinyltransferase
MTAASSTSTDAPEGAAFAVPSGGVARGAIRPPGSKSLTQRSYALALLARGESVVRRPLVADDTALALAALERLGCAVERRGGEVALRPGTPPAGGAIDCGNAGTLFRFLVAIAATIPGRWRLDGTPRLRERPVGPLVTALRALGTTIECDPERDGFAPLTVVGGTLGGGAVRLDAAESSQYLSALLMAGQRAAAPITIEVAALVSAPYVELTVDLVRRFGGQVESHGERGWKTWPSELHGVRYEVEPDLSAAAYPAAAAALTGGEVWLDGVSLATRQGDRRMLKLLRQMGAVIEPEEGGVRVRGGDLVAIEDDLSDIPDQVPTLAALAPFARGTTRISNVAHLRLKESDRLAAMASELRRAGAAVEELPDGLVIPGLWAASPPPSEPVTIDAHDDHRIAMAMALVGLRRPNLSIRNPQVVTKSWPEFWHELARLVAATEGSR